jgi:hypothetical protein
MIFNKENLKGKDDMTFYEDFTSLYPTIMSKCKLPYEFKDWLDIENKSTEEILNEIDKDDKYYYFIDCDIKALAPKFQKKVQNYPMFPETQTITANNYSKDQKFRSMVNNNSNKFKDQTLNTVSFFEKKKLCYILELSQKSNVSWL